MITVKLINPLHQFGKKTFTLIVTDSEARFPDFRVDKKYLKDWTNLQIKQDLKSTLIEYIKRLKAQDPPLTNLTWADVLGTQVTIDKIGGTKDTFILDN